MTIVAKFCCKLLLRESSALPPDWIVGAPRGKLPTAIGLGLTNEVTCLLPSPKNLLRPIATELGIRAESFTPEKSNLDQRPLFVDQRSEFNDAQLLCCKADGDNTMERKSMPTASLLVFMNPGIDRQGK